MTLEGAALAVLGTLVVLGTAWARWRLTHGPLRGPRAAGRAPAGPPRADADGRRAAAPHGGAD